MTLVADVRPAVRPVAFAPRRLAHSRLLRFAKTRPLGTFGLAIILILILCAALANTIAPYDPNLQSSATLQGPTRLHLLGTDNFGRDQFSRIVYGARISLIVSLCSVALSSAVGGMLGLVSGYAGGRADLTIQRVMDGMQAFPGLVLALAIVAAFGPGLFNVVLAIGITGVPRTARVVRSAALSVKEKEYVLAARAVGASPARIMLGHVASGCVAPFMIVASAGFGGAILAETALSFLGLGVPPPAPSWGGMLNGARTYLERAPWLAFFPGLAISLVVYGFNLFGDGLRDALDPRAQTGKG